MYAYAHATLDDETIKPTGFSSGDKLFAFIRPFYSFEGLLNFLKQQMFSFFKDLIQQVSALVSTVDMLVMSNSQPHMLRLIEQPHDNDNKKNLESDPGKSVITLLAVKHLGREIDFNTIERNRFRIAAIFEVPSPTTKTELVRFNGSRNFDSRLTNKLHVKIKLSLLHFKKINLSGILNWQHRFNLLKTFKTRDVAMILQNTKHN